MIDLPPEILASAFEVGVLTWGIRYLPPLCLVCKEWNQIIVNTPHLWGIIEVNTHSDGEFLLDQIARAKAAPLTIFVHKGALNSSSLAPAIKTLIALSPNWIAATIPLGVLNRCRWIDLRDRLVELHVANHGVTDILDSSRFFDGIKQAPPHRPPALRHLSVDHIYLEEGRESWDNHFLTPSIRSLNISGNNCAQVSSTLIQLSKTPNVEQLSIGYLHPQPILPSESLNVYLDSLLSLTVDSVELPSFLLSSISCRNLKSLTIDNASFYSSFHLISPFLTQWCSPTHLPSSLHSLKLQGCMNIDDVPHLIRFLARLPSLAVLSLIDDVLDYRPDENGPYTDENDILTALVSPAGARTGIGGWLCPSLREFNIEADISFQHLLDVVIQRGCNSQDVQVGLNGTSGSVAGPPKTLRTVIAYICSEGTKESREQLGDLVEETYCACTGCCFEKLKLIGESISISRHGKHSSDRIVNQLDCAA
ncbi:hypothetical protein MD484_g3110, partial [Candolleomyces efflorescens]